MLINGHRRSNLTPHRCEVLWGIIMMIVVPQMLLAQSPQNSPPAWLSLPPIHFSNSRPDSQLVLSDYCTDPDGDPITFTGQSPAPELVVSVDPQSGRVTLSAGEDLQGRFDVLFRAEDGYGNAASIIAAVWVDDVLPPRISLSYHHHPLLDDRAVLWIHTDKTARNIFAELKSNGSPVALEFNRVASDSNFIAWRAQYRFPQNGHFRLVATATDQHSLSASDSLSILMSSGGTQ